MQRKAAATRNDGFSMQSYYHKGFQPQMCDHIRYRTAIQATNHFISSLTTSQTKSDTEAGK